MKVRYHKYCAKYMKNIYIYIYNEDSLLSRYLKSFDASMINFREA